MIQAQENNKSNSIARENISFKFKPELIKVLKKNAKKQNRSVNNYVETTLEQSAK